MNRPGMIAAFFFISLVTLPARGQGPASCGFHLDVRADLTSTHSAVADVSVVAPGVGVGLPVGAPGSPYTAYATPGSPMAIIVSGNSLAYGPAPIGPGSCLTIFYAVGAPMVPLPLGPPFIGTCWGGPHILGILPAPSVLFDACGFTGPPPPFGFVDLGGGRFTFTGLYPAIVPPVVTLQAAGMTPGGAIWLTNAVSIITGPNPAEAPLPAPFPCGAFPALDDGQSLALPAPAGFAFYGVPTPVVDVATNGYIDMVPGVGPAVAGGCDIGGTVGDFGCPIATPTARPRIDVNHTDFDFTVVPAAPFLPAMTMEFRPASPAWPEAWIYRWKNASLFGTAPGVAGLSTSDFCVELWGPVSGVSSVVVVRSWIMVAAQVGIGPGLAGQGYTGPAAPGPPSTCALGVGGLALMSTFSPPMGAGYFNFPAGDVIHMNTAAASAALANSAIWFFQEPTFAFQGVIVF